VTFSIDYDRDVSAGFQKLHHGLAFTRHFCPPRFGIRILFQSAEFSAFEAEIDLFQLALGSLADGIAFAIKIDGLLFIDQRLLPDRD
jgi:hypothetical protein